MSLQPKTRKYRYCFRNKTNISKDLLSEKKNRKLINASFSMKSSLLNTSTLPFSPIFANKVSKTWGKTSIETVFKSLNLSGSFIHFATQANKFFIDKTGPLTLSNIWPYEKSNKFLTFCSIQQKKAVDFTNTNQKSMHYAFCTSFPFYSKDFDSSSLQTNQISTEKFKQNQKNVLTFKASKSSSWQFHQKSQAFHPSLAALDKVRFGTCGFYFCASGTVSAKFLETARLGIARKLKKSGRFWIRICADTPVTARSAETRMGRGKGAFSHYEAKVTPGQIFLEFSGVPLETIKLIFTELSKKTPVPIKIAL
uniref:Ribosomal protein L16 n=1 Tax=Gloeotilopsis planctonica TaxID=34157 RepID=A0A1B2RYZ6_9CHLO|nr:ribosomal protein L16 [Gloeotilopsis planctonica]